MTPRTGRPKSDNPRTITIGVRVTPDEAAALTAAAEKASEQLGPWLRAKGLAAAKRAR